MKVHYHMQSSSYENLTLTIWDKNDHKVKEDMCVIDKKDDFGVIIDVKEKKILNCNEIEMQFQIDKQKNAEIFNMSLKPKPPSDIWIIEGETDIFTSIPNINIVEKHKNKMEVSNTQKSEVEIKAEDQIYVENEYPTVSRNELKAELNKLFLDLRNLEDKADLLRSQTTIDDMDSSPDYKFIREVLDVDIDFLQSAYKGMRNIVISIQDRQEKIADTLYNLNKQAQVSLDELKNDFESSRIKLKERIEDVQSDFHSNIESIQGDLKAQIEGVHNDFRGNIDSVQGELKGQIDGMQNELSRKIDSNQINLKDNNEKLIKMNSDYYKNLSIIAKYVLKMAEVLEVDKSLTSLGFNRILQKMSDNR